jgi:hypothetical protein
MDKLTKREISILNGILSYLDPEYSDSFTVKGLRDYCSEVEATIQSNVVRLLNKGWLRKLDGQDVYLLAFKK